MLNKEIPFLRIGLPLCIGIISGLYFKPDKYFLLTACIVAFSGFCFSLFFNKCLANCIYGISLTFTLFTTGLLLYSNEKGKLSDLDTGEGEYLCTLSDYPQEKENSFSLIVRLDGRITKAGSIPLHGSLLVYFRKDPIIGSFRPGDILKVRCSPVRIVNRGNPEEFDYRFYMENHGIKYYAFAGIENITGYHAPEHRKLRHIALITREKIISMYRERGISGDTLALVAAITLGQKNMLDQEQKQYFIRAGIMHIMAVSGLHAMILSLFVFNLLYFLKRRLNFLRSLITVLFLWMFAFVTGLTPSVLRATIMFTFLQGGKLIQRDVNSLNSVLASAFILLIARPSALFDAGFLLSYSAVIYIICFYRGLYQKASIRNRLADKIWQSVVVTITAQAGTLPLTIMLFNRFPTWFIFTNIIIVPIASLLIVLGCMVPLTFPLEILSGLLASLLGNLAGITEMLTETASELPFSTIDNIGLTAPEALFLFCFIFLTFWYMLNMRSVPVLYPKIALLPVVLLFFCREVSTRTTNELIVYNTFGSTVIGIRTGKILNLYSDTIAVQPEVLRHCAVRRLKPSNNLIVNNFTILKAGDEKILISSFLSDGLLKRSEPDFIIMTSNYSKSGNRMTLSGNVKSLVLTGNLSTIYRIEDRFVKGIIDTIHYCKKSGGFRLKI